MPATPGTRLRCGKCGQPGHNSRSCGRQPIPRSRKGAGGNTKADALRKFYRLDYADFLAMVAAGCGVCHRSLDGQVPDVDHDHKCDHPGKGMACCRACVRGTLHRSCNLRVGAFERGLNRDPDVAAYLTEFTAVVIPRPRQGVLF